MRRILFWSSLVMIFSLPLESTVDIPSVGTLSRAIGLVVVSLWIISVLVSGRVRQPHPFHVVFLLFVAWNATTLLWSTDLTLSLMRLLTWVQLVGLTLVVWDVYTTREAVRLGLQAYVLGAAASVASAVQNYVMGGEQEYVARYAATGFHTDGFAVMLALSVPLALYLAAQKADSGVYRILRVANYAFIPAALLGIGLAATRTAVVALVPGAVFGLWSLTRLQVRSRVLILLCLVGGLFVVQALVPTTSMERLAGTGQELTEGDLNGRLVIWREGLQLFASRPLLGVGTGAYASANSIGKAAHNSFLSVLVETGLIGFVCFGAVLLIVARQAMLQPRWESGFWISVLLAWMIGASALTYEHKKHTWLILSMTVASSCVWTSERSAPGRVPDPGWGPRALERGLGGGSLGSRWRREIDAS